MTLHHPQFVRPAFGETGHPYLDRSPDAKVVSPNRLVLPLSVVAMSLLLCGCASGLMSMPAAGGLAKSFGGRTAATDSTEKKAESRTRAKGGTSDEDNDFGNTIDTPLLSEYMSVQGNSIVVLRGVGLVTGLDGTGGDPAPSALRTQLQNEMARRGVKNPKHVLASPNTALVVITAYLPAMVRKDQRFDVRVTLPKNSNATSLKGGWLLETRLFEEQNFDGRSSLKAQEYAVCGGAILTSLGVRANQEDKQAELMSGTIPGGAISRVDRDLSIVLRTDKRSFRNSTRIANAVSERFHRYNSFGQKISCAEAKTDSMIQLKTHEQYINNFPRYQAVIRNIAFNETDVARRIRTEQLAREILEPEKCQAAALQLEAIGDSSIVFLKDALDSDDFEVRFHAAQSLAYLGDATGVPVLMEAVRDQPAFRVYALVALSVIDDADAVISLRELMNSDDIETCYGAFRALKESDPLDPSLNAVEFRNRFTMHVIDSTGSPKVHVTRRRAPEVVLFGARQGLHLPAVLNAGRRLLVKGDKGSSTVEVIRYSLDEESQRTQVPNELLEIIKACGEMGASYPDIVQLLIEAEQQHNFVGQFGIDRLPQAGRLYVSRTESAEDAETDADEMSAEDAKRIGAARQIPELFDELDEEELKINETDEKLMSLDFQAVAERDGTTSPATENASDVSDESMTADALDSADSPQPQDQPDEIRSPGQAEATDTSETTELPEETASAEEQKPKRRWSLPWSSRKTQAFDGLAEP